MSDHTVMACRGTLYATTPAPDAESLANHPTTVLAKGKIRVLTNGVVTVDVEHQGRSAMQIWESTYQGQPPSIEFNVPAPSDSYYRAATRSRTSPRR